MRWYGWLSILLTELISVGLSTIAGILANVLTNEQQPKRSVIVGIIAFAASSAILQTARSIIGERQSRSSSKVLSNIEKNTETLLIKHHESTGRADDRYFEEDLAASSPEVLRPWIKLQWQADPLGVERLLKALYDPTTKPLSVIAEWQIEKPKWFNDLNWPTLLVAAELAGSYNGSNLAADLFVEAVKSGSTRRHYWTARAALLRAYQGDEADAQRILQAGGVNSDSPDQFAQIVTAIANDDHQRAERLLASWAPEEFIDILLSAVMRTTLIMSVAMSHVPPVPNYARIAAIYRETIQAIPISANPKQGLSITLISMANKGTSSDRHSDRQEALDLAIQAREICRRQRSSSVEAVALACQAAYEDGQFHRVIEIGSATGEATPDEADSDLVRFFVASAALISARTDITDNLIPLIKDSYRKALLTAAVAEFSGHASEDTWRDALNHARDTPERVQALVGLARMGILESQSVDEVAEAAPQQAKFIRAVAAAGSGSPNSAIQALRSLEEIDLNSATALASTYLQVGDVTSAAEVLRESAQKLNEPRLRLDAAQLLWQEGEKSAASIELEELLVDSGSNQNLRHNALALLGQWAADEEQWAVAQGFFQQLLTLDPRDDKARWAVILTALRQGLFSGAVRFYNSAPSEPAIVYPEHARAWMAVKRHEEQIDSVNFVKGVIGIADKFPENEDVQADAIQTILSPGEANKPPLPAPVQELFNELCERFFRTWPDSLRLRRFTAEDIRSLVNQMEDLVRPTQQQKILQREVAEHLSKNTLPWAFLSAMTGRSYSEVVIKRAVGILPAQHIDAAEQRLCVDAAYAALDKEVVLDISSGVVLTELGDLADLLIGKFKRLLVSEGERLDAVLAVEFLRGRSTSSWVYDEKSDRGRIVEVPSEIADQNYEDAVKLRDLLYRCRAATVSIKPPLSDFGDLATSAWASAVQCAEQHSATFWCDDVALRVIARTIGVPCFSTPALLEALAIRQEISAAQRESAIRNLIRVMVGDFPPNRERLSELTAEYGDVAGPIATVFSRAAAWSNVSGDYLTWISLVEQVASFDQTYAADWVHTGTAGITRFLTDSEMRRAMGSLLLAGAAAVVSRNPDAVAKCVEAARAGLDATRNQDYDDDPLKRTAAVLRDSLARHLGLTNATIHVSSMFSTLAPPDRHFVLEALYGQ
jgi:tetratricopeptide (TPR) repeat protein